jgi:Methyl-accepting chemotaxis protein
MREMDAKKKKKKSLRGSIMLLCVLLVVLTVTAVGFNGILAIKEMASTAYDTYVAAVNSGYNAEIKSEVQSTISVLQSEYDKFAAGEKTEEQAKEDAKEIIRIMRYRDDQSGYFWIDDTNYILVMHPVLADQEGAYRFELKDPNGVMIIQEIMKTCQSAEKGGFNEFYFTKADGVTVAPKVAYSQIFEPWGWIVSTGNYVDDMEADMAEVKDYLKKAYDSALLRVDIVFVVVIALALGLAFVYGTHLVKPLKKMQAFAVNMSEGDLTAEIYVKQKDEIGQTADAMNIAQKNMQKLIEGIMEVAQGVNEALDNFEKVFNNMRTSIGEASKAIDSIANNVSGQAASTDAASDEVVVIAEKIEKTGVEVERLDDNAKDMQSLSIQSMNTLNHLIEVNNKTRTNIEAMHKQTELTNQSVQQIQGAANLINEISDQTGLLALNASIEAARAGELGRGFTVVADEIAKLAHQSAASVEEINRVVNELLANASQSVSVMQEINTSVDVQVTSLSETQDKFNQLFKELENCVISVRAIDEMTGEMEKQRENVTGSLALLNRLAQDNAASAQETSAMTVELSEVVDESDNIIKELEGKVQVLMESVNKFKV